VLASAKSGIGIDEVLQAIVDASPRPRATATRR
jgi:translation elongation factor EF-4